MDPVTSSIISSYFVGISASATIEVIKEIFSKACSEKPELEEKLKSVKSSYEFESVFNEAVNVIDLSADNGSIEIDGGCLEALRGIRFDHSDGLVQIVNSEVISQILQTGGLKGSKGKTIIGENTEMKSRGTRISLGKGCSIKITGGASIKQS